jgi:2-iminobutanoate/2-iminopropanoate deaminase
MPRFFNPPTVIAPASRYSQGAEHFSSGRRLLVSGQVGMRLDGTLPDTLEEQMEVAWDNLIAVLRAAEMTVNDLVKVTVYVTVPGSVGPFRAMRDAKLAGHAPACTYLEVAGLARPDFLVEVEGEAVKE